MLPGVLVELLIHAASTSESQEAASVDQKDQKPAIGSGLGRGRLVKGGNQSGRAVVPQGWHRGCRCRRVCICSTEGLEEERCSFFLRTGEAILKLEL